jgi:hypothetical protein
MTTTIDEHNTEEIAKLKCWRQRVSLIYYAAMVEMPIGFLLPCIATGIINMNHLGLHYAQIAMLSAILLPLVGLAGVLLMRFDRNRSLRSLAIARLADEHGMRYWHQPPAEEFADLRDLHFINLEHVIPGGSGENLVVGTFKKRPLMVIDYSYNHHYGNKIANTQQTIVLFRDELVSLPDFVVVRQGFGARLEQLIGETPFGKRLKVPDENEFNERFTLAGQDRSAVVACLTSEVIDLLLEQAGLTILVQDGKLMVARQNVLVPASEYEQLLLTATKLMRALERAAQ